MISSATRSSKGPSNRENQDVCYITSRRFCVADGHGPFGREIAETVCATVRDAPDTISDEDMFAQAEETVGAIAHIRHILSGTTATVLTVELDGTCRVSAVGDSEARYYDSDEGDGVPLTLDHSPLSPEEHARIRALPSAAACIFARNPPYTAPRPVFVLGNTRPGMDIQTEWVPHPQGGFEYCNVRSEWSTYIAQSGNKLAVTRAIGDFPMKHCGLIATPSTVTAPPPAVGTTRAIVLASDGLWDCMHYSEVRNIVRNPACLGNAELAAERLQARAEAQANTHFGSHHDYISVIVVYVAY